MIGHVGLVAIAVASVAIGLCGLSLLRTPAAVSGALMLLASFGVVAGVACWWAGRDDAGAYAFGGGLEIGLGLALVTYPRPRHRHSVDFCALVLTSASGVAGTVYLGRTGFAGAMVMVLVGTLAAHTWWRFEVSGEDDRLAILWMLLAICTAVVIFGHSVFLTPPTVCTVIGSVVFGSVGPAMVIGVRRPRLVDVRGLIVQVVVLVVAVIVYISLFIGALATVDALGRPTPSTGALAVIGAVAATTFHPLQVMLRGVVDELLFGDRPDPLDAAARVVDRIGDDPVLALRAIREALVLPYASLWAGDVELASSGTAVTHVRRLALRLGDDEVGEIVVGLRTGDLTLSPGDEHVLRIVAPLLAQTLRARALADDLQASRGQAIAAIEEERRRLRRDLHDGLGPTLSGIAFTADAARNTLRHQPDSADELLRNLRADAVTAVGEIRRLVYDMRPPALDELGLVPALRQRAATMRTEDGRAMRVTIEAPTSLPGLAAAVETAAYRIALEALTNAARHSGSDTAELAITIRDDHLDVRVRDAGRHGRSWTPGVGISSMRERAAEVGGTLTVDGTTAGAQVEALLPLS